MHIFLGRGLHIDMFGCVQGMGEAELDTEDDFSRVGRVNAMLARRLELLAQVLLSFICAPFNLGILFGLQGVMKI